MALILHEIASCFKSSEARIEKMASQGHFTPADTGGPRRPRKWTVEEALHVGLTLALADRGIPVAEAALHARTPSLADFHSDRYLVVWRAFWVGISDPRHPSHSAWDGRRLGATATKDCPPSTGDWCCAIVDFDEVAAHVREFGTVTIISLGDLRSRLEERGLD